MKFNEKIRLYILGFICNYRYSAKSFLSCFFRKNKLVHAKFSENMYLYEKLKSKEKILKKSIATKILD